MRKRRIAILLVAAVALVVLAVTLVPRKAEPSYQGKPLSSWLEENFHEGLGGDRELAGEAIRRIGTNGIPWLLGWVTYDPPPQWKVKLWNSLPGRVREFRLVQRVFNVGSLARFLGTREAFHILGTDALVPLMSVAANPNAPKRPGAVYALGFLGTNAMPAMPLILNWMAEPDPEVARYAVYALTNLRVDVQHSIPAITNRFQTADAKLRLDIVNALGFFGKDARLAVPTLVNALNDPDPQVQKLAASILQKIAPEALGTNAAR